MTKTAGISRLHRAARKAGSVGLRPLPLALALIAGGLSTPASALDYTWLGGEGHWNDSAMWSLLGVPGSSDSASIATVANNQVMLSDTRSVGHLTLTSGRLGGIGTLNTGSLIFNGSLGLSTATAGGVLNVAGSTSINGADVQFIGYNHTLNLNGNTLWSVGNGLLVVDPASSGAGGITPASVLNIGAGTVFTDAGAASANGQKSLGHWGGNVNNAGTYERNGQGTTFATSFNNTGVVNVNAGTFALNSGNFNSQSSGQFNIAAGSVLELSNASFTSGAIQNAGLVRIGSGDTAMAAGVLINGAWVVEAHNGRLQTSGTHTMSSLVINDGFMGGTGVVNTGSLNFNSGSLGLSTATAGGMLNVAGNTSINGADVQFIGYNHTLNLNGNTQWSAGNGRLEVDTASSGGSGITLASVLNIGAGTVFTDAGAASVNGQKSLGHRGGNVNNAGTYERNGLGTTVAKNFNNTGILQINGGSFEVGSDLVNQGTINIGDGATLTDGNRFDAFANTGRLTGTGTVVTFSADDALTNSGTIDPGSAAALGTLTINGDLQMANGSVLRIDLGGSGLSDKLAITSDLTLSGELAVWGAPGTVLQAGEVYTIATYAQRLGNTTFESVSWHGLNSADFAVSYTANSIELRVTAVPEPGSLALLLAGLVTVGSTFRRQLARPGQAETCA